MELKEELDYEEEEQDDETSEDRAGKLIARKNSEKQAKAVPIEVTKQSLKMGLELYGNPATNNILKQAWLQIISTWGFSSLWINIHILLSKVFGNKFFRKLKLPEKMGIALIDIGCLAIIIGISVILGMLYELMKNPFGVFWELVFN